MLEVMSDYMGNIDVVWHAFSFTLLNYGISNSIHRLVLYNTYEYVHQSN